MRAPASAALLAALLAGCTVDVDGAPCATPGTTGDCPGGQACGNDRRCSARALGCQASRCTPGTGDACLDAGGLAPGTARARWCTDADPVCGAWTDDPCTARGYVCGTRSGAARCECPEPGDAERVVWVRRDGAPAGALPFGTGAAAPPGCALRTLGDGLARADQLRGLDPATVVTVTAAGVPAGETWTFSSAAGEQLPLSVHAGIVLRSDADAGGGGYELVLDDPGKLTGVYLRAGAALEGFTIRNAALGAARRAVTLVCLESPAPVRLTRVRVEARAASGLRLGRGVWGEGSCALLADAVEVRDAGEFGMLFEPDPVVTWPARVSLSGGVVAGSGGAGIAASGGALLLDGVRVEANAGRGVDVAPVLGPASLAIAGSAIVRNGDTGIAAASPTELRVDRTTVFGNGATTAWGGAAVPSGVSRRAGGLVLSGEPPAVLQLTRNRIYSNAGDQVLVLASAAPWALDGGCGEDGAGPLFNQIGCYDPTPSGTTVGYRGVVAIDATVTVTGTWWSAGTPSLADDVWRFGATPGGPPALTPWCTWAHPTLGCGAEAPLP